MSGARGEVLELTAADGGAMSATLEAALHTGRLQLVTQARALAGATLAELAARLDVPLPNEPKRHKGFVGRLLEQALGGAASGVVDFPLLGLELKTLPTDAHGQPRESTFVCHADLARIADTDWEQSRVKAKLACVLFLPIEHDKQLGFGQRRIGAAFLWSPSREQEALLRADFDELAGRIGCGELEHLSAHVGRALQLRPKGRDSQARVRALDATGALLRHQPRAFYLRASFTAQLVRAALAT